MAKYNEIKEIITQIDAIQTALAASDIATAQTDVTNAQDLLKKFKKSMVGEDNTTYTYQCNKCGLTCTMVLKGIDLADLTFCVDDMKPGKGKFIQTDLTKSV